MAERTAIEWTDATSEIERVRPARRHDCDFVEKQSVKKGRMGLARGGVEPPPHIFHSLGAVAGRTCGHHVTGLGQPASLECDHMIPCGSDRPAICAMAAEFFKNGDSGGRRNAGKSAPPSKPASPTAIAKSFVACVVQPRISVRASATKSSAYHVHGHPRRAPGAPCEALASVLSAEPDGRTSFATVGVTTLSADIASTVRTAAIYDEILQRPIFKALPAPLLAVVAARDVASVLRPCILTEVRHA